MLVNRAAAAHTIKHVTLVNISSENGFYVVRERAHNKNTWIVYEQTMKLRKNEITKKEIQSRDNAQGF